MYPATPHTIATPRGSIVEVPPAVERRLGQRTPFGGGWGLRLARPGRVVREIARRTGLSRNTITKHLAEGTIEPKFATPDRPSKLDPFAEKLPAG